MYIKQIIIQGFKSYKDQTVIEPFSSKTNVIVGRNGSGKSNFFAAIRFVLSDAYTQMGREERQALLHEGSGSAVMSAYVEVIFDNTDDRFPTGRPELVLRRTIGLKKDEYSLDRRNATKADVMNLLESAGFSRSNPYYIVPQGRVTALTNMKDSERLSLLKEVAGTHVYESRREESLKIMSETDAKQVKIDELLDYIRVRLSELEEEKNELRAYQDKDRDRRCLEYTIYFHEQEELNQAISELDNRRERGVDETDQDRQRLLDGEAEKDRLDGQVGRLSQQVDSLRAERRQVDAELTGLVREHAQAELAMGELTAGQSAAAEAAGRRQVEMAALQEQLAAREADLAQLLPQYAAAQQIEETTKTALEDAQRQRQQLFAKQTRTTQFRTRADRDQYLAGQIRQCQSVLTTRETVRQQAAADIDDLTIEIGRLESEIADLRSRFDNRGDELETLAAAAQESKDSRDAVIDERKELWRAEMRLDSDRKQSEQVLSRAERQLGQMVDQATFRGLAAVRRLTAELDISGVYGPVADLFTVHEAYKTAVEVTAGQSLFHVVVDTDETASKLLELLVRDRLGRVTFMPLNRLRSRQTNLPRASDAIPLVSKLEFDSEVEKAFDHVFGRTIVCPNLQVAAQYARSHNVTAITPQGDRSDRKGALTGGYHDPRSSRMDGWRTLSQARADMESHRLKRIQLDGDLGRIEQRVTLALSEVQKAEQRRQQYDAAFGPLRQQLRHSQAELQARIDEREAQKRTIAHADAAVKMLQAQIDAHEAERGSEFRPELDDAEADALEQLGPQIQTLQQRLLTASNTRADLERRKTQIEATVRENLRPRLDQASGLTEPDGVGASSADVRAGHDAVARLTRALRDRRNRAAELESEIESAATQLGSVRNECSVAQRALDDLASAIDRHQRRMEKNMAKKAIVADKAAECARNIRDLGVLPDNAFDKYAKLAPERAIKRLHTVNEALKQYAHVNKKAFEQYSNFTRQRDTLLDRRNELDQSQESIQRLIDVLDRRKDEAIERTFKQVSREFARVFEKLVPAGMGRLIIQRRTDRAVQPVDEAESEDEEMQASTVESYVGVGITVSFNSKHDDQQRIQQLSGGQKSLCALALVFAIQQSDPAPFYLFDEIDANLDAQYRTAVAAMLDELSEPPAAGENGEVGPGGGQFICTTFRPEMVHVAEKCYGVSYSNKTSSIDVVDRDAALAFVEGQKQ